MDKYIVVESMSISYLTQRINYHLENGYLCLGGICANNKYFYQAMILEEAPKYRACP